MAQYCADLNRNIEVVNLDPAAEHFDYIPFVDIRELIQVQDTMEDEELHFGPNGITFISFNYNLIKNLIIVGGLVFCIEYLLENSDWLRDRIGKEKLCVYIEAFLSTILVLQVTKKMTIYCLIVQDK